MIPVWGVKGIPCLSNVFGVVLMLSFFLFYTRASQVYLHAVAPTLAIRSSPTGTTYVKKGEILTLNVSYTYTGNRTVRVQWTIGDKIRIIERDAAGFVNKFDDRASIRDSASLVLTNTTVADSESYIITLNAGDVEDLATEQCPVIITEQPTAKTNCSNMTVDQGKDVTCRCFNISGNPAPTASWSKSGVTGTIGGEGYLEKILSLKNVSASDSGIYFCNVQSHDLPDQVSISVKVKSAPSVTSFEADTEDSVLGTSTTITCEATGFPKPTYTISHNGTVVQNGTTYTIKAVRYEDSGQYKCVASNSLGNSFKKLPLIVKGSVVTTSATSDSPETSTENTFTEIPTGENDESNGCNKVLITEIVVVCLLIFVALVHCCCFFKGSKSENDESCGCYARKFGVVALVLIVLVLIVLIVLCIFLHSCCPKGSKRKNDIYNTGITIAVLGFISVIIYFLIGVYGCRCFKRLRGLQLPEIVSIAERIPSNWYKVALCTDLFAIHEVQNIRCTRYDEEASAKALTMLERYVERQGSRENLAKALAKYDKKLAQQVRSGYILVVKIESLFMELISVLCRLGTE